ncbi:ABC transporter ATP-binding protein [uncultured Robinsoniella sp.]|uniref:ABC transporter ATP-binding protein n=1 Tax=uncultured Robinsoniella sp. TaxID=904190 RepID=UPI00374FAFF6
MNQECIQTKDLQIAYDNDIIIHKLNLKIPKGKITMVIGSNGCGKSTLLKAVSRIIPSRHGDILLHGKSLRRQASKSIARKMAVLPQSPSVPSGLMVKELVAYGRFPYQSPMSGLKEHDLQMIEWAMHSTGVYDLREKMVDSLSGGQRQRAWIAMALAQETEILVLDEPTTYLDMSHQIEILKLLKKLNLENNRTIIMVIHELNHASKFADHLIGMKKGSVLFEGAPADVITRENLVQLYGINARLEQSRTGDYPICVDYDTVDGV